LLQDTTRESEHVTNLFPFIPSCEDCVPNANPFPKLTPTPKSLETTSKPPDLRKRLAAILLAFIDFSRFILTAAQGFFAARLAVEALPTVARRWGMNEFQPMVLDFIDECW